MSRYLQSLALRSLPALLEGRVNEIAPSLREYLASKGAVHGDRVSPLRAAVALVELGVPPERATSLLDWREFEELVAEFLESAGYVLLARRLRFREEGRRWEIDLLARHPLASLAVECKKWSAKRGLASKLRVAARDHKSRVSALARVAGDLGLNLRNTRLIPVIVSWYPERATIVGGIPVVPIYGLNSFLVKLDPLDEDLLSFQL